MADPIVNFFKSTLVGTYSNTDTSFTIATGDGAKLPDPSTDGEFNLVIYEGTAGVSANAFEIVRVTAKSGDVLTVTREQEGTTALTIGATTHSIILSATKKTFDDIQTAISNVDLTNIAGAESITFDTTGDEVFQLPSGTTAQRPTSPANGYMRYNTDLYAIEAYINDYWVIVKENPLEIQSLVIAGGGGGSTGYAGGGGAGGYRSSVSGESSGGGASAEASLIGTLGSSYTVTIGAGGTGGVYTGVRAGTSGSNSVFNTITSIGGGAGGCATAVAGSGGSGGGGGSSSNTSGGAGTSGQGYAGGASPSTGGGGGGGAGVVGAAGVSSVGGNGGDGVESFITGTGVYRAGGGGGFSGGLGGLGGGGNSATVAQAGTVNTGGGGGAGSTSASGRGGAGGSGVVILKYPSIFTISVGAGLTASTSTVGDYKITSFTAGTDTISFS